jgi:AraC-like DNA-binding protein
MKLMHEQVDFPGRSAIKVKWREMPHFTYPWHFHSEFELLYVIDGKGTSFVADSIEHFQDNDLVLIGSNLPHFWRRAEAYFQEKNSLKVNYIVIQFPGDFFKDQINNYPEFYRIGELLKRSSRGIRFEKEIAKKVSNKIIKVNQIKGIKRILLLLEILELLATTDKYRFLAGELYQHETHDFTNDRLTRVMHFLNTNYRHKIELKKVAEIANLHPSAFCRFFKEKSGKSLSEFVNDLRIGYACRLIIENKLSMSQICFECGFNNLSNFNKTFKKHLNLTPSGYLREFYNK